MKNKNNILLVLVFGLLSSLLQAQTVETAFVSMPDEYYLSLPKAQRKEMVKAFKNDTVHARRNLFRGKSTILEIDTINQFMTIQNSPSAKVHLKVLNNSTPGQAGFYVLIFTACGPICDSQVGCYNTEWIFLKNSLLPKVSIKDFLNNEKIEAEGKKADEVAEQFDIVFLESAFLENGNNIEVSLNSGKFLEKENFDRLKAYLKGDKILFTWGNNIYTKGACYWGK